MDSQPLAYMDPQFLESGDARPIRILAEYLEPHRRFRAKPPSASCTRRWKAT